MHPTSSPSTLPALGMISSAELLESHFSCPICCSLITKASLTVPCGHRYCTECIKECLNRKKLCPCCNMAVDPKNLIRDHQFDDLLDSIQTKQKLAEDQYYAGLVQESVNKAARETACALPPNRVAPSPATSPHLVEPGNTSSSSSGPSVQTASSIPGEAGAGIVANGGMVRQHEGLQAILQKHLSRSMTAFYLQLQVHNEKRLEQINRIETEINVKVESVKTSDFLTQDEKAGKLALLHSEAETKRAVVERDFECKSQELLATCDRFLTSSLFVPTLADNSPLSFDIVDVSTKTACKRVQLKATSSLATLIDLFKLALEEALGDRIAQFEPGSSFVIVSDPARATPNSASVHPEDQVVPFFSGDNRSVALSSVTLRPHNHILFVGAYLLDSRIPKPCAKKCFVAGQENIVNYYSCGTCKLNWICEGCANDCHAGHSVSMYLRSHKAKFACCYCDKSRQCCKSDNTAV